RSHAGAAYKAYLALWLPVMAVAAALTVFWPHLAWVWALGAWWLKPLLERAPLYVLSRQVFGTAVTWQEAVRAWPRQLGGGWLRLLTWGRPLAQTRCLHQSVWQLEMARGAVARARRQVLSRQGTGVTAFWFCIVAFVLECVLQLGIIGLIGLFMGNSEAANPFALLAALGGDGDKLGYALLMLAIYATASAIIAPIYTACGFTLYLNRRASLEAWDLELQLRQFKRPAAERARARGLPGAALLAAVLLAGMLCSAPDSLAAAPAAVPDPACRVPDRFNGPLTRGAAANDAQKQVRREVDALYASPQVHGWVCEKDWRWKETAKPVDQKAPELPDLSGLAAVMKVLIIAGAIGLVGWLLYRYSDRFPALRRRPQAVRATEVGGLDIRAESLPDDVTATVRTLWARGERRPALALLYRATLSRLVSDDGLALTQGNTEGDCLRLAGVAAQQARLAAGRLQVAAATTTMWLDGAYAARWPDSDTLERRCAEWDAQFGPAGSAP
ncbi:MAG TPA: hypothetical protein VFS95_13925, partial [Telluria sp.]|nr:hypothetical protein [Telluria sp.]